MECNHKSSSKKVVSHDYFGLTFNAKMDVCHDCGAHLWTNELRLKLNEWLVEKKRNHRDAFVVQANLSENSKKCLHEMIRIYPGITSATMMRAMTLVFLSSLERSEASMIFEQVAEREVYKSLHHGDKTVCKVQFGPSGMLDISSWSKILHMKSSKIVEEAVYRMTSLYIEKDPKLKAFWESQILPQISLILKAAS